MEERYGFCLRVIMEKDFNKKAKTKDIKWLHYVNNTDCAKDLE